jgi:hypothetical protein
MAEYSVCVRRSVLEETWIDVETPNRDRAGKAALALLDEGGAEWEYARPPEEWIEVVVSKDGVEPSE